MSVLHRLVWGKKIKKASGVIVRVAAVLRTNEGDLEEIKKFRELLFDATKTKILDLLLLVHYQAAILCPSTKKMVFLEGFAEGKYNRRHEALEGLYHLLSDLEDKLNQTDVDCMECKSGEEETQTEGDTDGDENMSGLGSFVFEDDVSETRESVRNEARSELKAYLSEVHSGEVKDQAWRNPYCYWMDKVTRSRYPVLHKLAVWLLAIPAASAAVERLFSRSSGVCSIKRLSLNPETLTAICQLNKQRT